MDESPKVRLYRMAYEPVREAIVVLASDGRLLFANSAAGARSAHLVDGLLAHLQGDDSRALRGAVRWRGRARAELEIDHVPIALDCVAHGDQLVVRIREQLPRSLRPTYRPPSHRMHRGHP
jgi:hypothetical protein